MTTLVSAKSTWKQPEEEEAGLDWERFSGFQKEQAWFPPPPPKYTKKNNLKHLLSKQVVPHFPLDVPVDQITLKREYRKTMTQNLWGEQRLSAWGGALTPSGRAGCKRDPRDLWSHRADWLWRFSVWTSWSETGSLGSRWGRQRLERRKEEEWVWSDTPSYLRNQQYVPIQDGFRFHFLKFYLFFYLIIVRVLFLGFCQALCNQCQYSYYSYYYG